MLGTINTILQSLQSILSGIALAVCVLFIMWGGFQYMTAGGSPRGQEEGKSTIRGALVGLVIVFAANVIATTVRGFVGAQGG